MQGEKFKLLGHILMVMVWSKGRGAAHTHPKRCEVRVREGLICLENGEYLGREGQGVGGDSLDDHL